MIDAALTPSYGNADVRNEALRYVFKLAGETETTAKSSKGTRTRPGKSPDDLMRLINLSTPGLIFSAPVLDEM